MGPKCRQRHHHQRSLEANLLCSTLLSKGYGTTELAALSVLWNERPTGYHIVQRSALFMAVKI